MIAFERHPAKVLHLNVRTENHGEDEVLAVDIKLTFELPGSVLDRLSPSLCASLFEAANDPEFAFGDEGPPLRHVRHTGLGVMRWSATWRDARLVLYVDTDSDECVAFDNVTVGRLTLKPREGGMVTFAVLAQVHPRTESDSATLLSLLKHEIPATLDAQTDDDDGGERS